LDLAIRRMLSINNSLLGLRPPQSLRALPDQCNGMCLFIYLLTGKGSRFEMKKDLRVSRVGPGWSLNAFFFLPIRVIKTCHGKGEGGTSTLVERSTAESCMLRSGRMNRS
jgi:hypothetical protein